MAPETECTSAGCAHDHHDHHHNEEHDDGASDAGSVEAGEGMNRGEKKARKAFSKLGLHAVAGVERVAMKRGRIVFAIARPTVYRVGTSDVYVVFGEVKGEDTAAAMAAQRMAALRAMQAAEQGQAGASQQEEDSADEESDGKEDADDSSAGVDEKDVTIVMEQTSATRAAAIKALKENNNDIVSAIMALSS